jgi:N utilization substance protein A
MKPSISMDVVANLKELAKEKKLNPEVVLDSLKEALIMAARKYTGIQKRFEVEIDEESESIRVYLNVEVVEDFPDPPEGATADEVARMDEHYMLLDEAEDYNEDAQVGDQLTLEVDIEAFGRQAIQQAKQGLLQKVRDAEKKRVLAEYSTRLGTLISADVTQIERGNLIMNLGTTEAILPARHLMRRDRFRQGDKVLALIADVSDGSKGAQVLLSRTDNRFLIELIKRDVPSVFDGTVEIVSVARDAGVRSKIIVRSRDERMDPVASLIGQRGMIIQGITRELNNERIDIIPWSEDLHSTLRRAFSPCEVRRIEEVPGVARIVVTVNDDDVAIAIGKNRSNLRLVGQLLGRTIDAFGDREFNEMSPEEQESLLSPRHNDKPLSNEASAQQSRQRDKFSELNALFRDSQED